jgi:hypothetical protein
MTFLVLCIKNIYMFQIKSENAGSVLFPIPKSNAQALPPTINLIIKPFFMIWYNNMVQQYIGHNMQDNNLYINRTN